MGAMAGMAGAGLEGLDGTKLFPKLREKDFSNWPSIEEQKERRLQVKNLRRAINGLPPLESYKEVK